MKFSALSAAIFAALSSGSVLATDQLDQIVVSANNTPQTLRSVTSNTVVITREDIEDKQYQTLADALKGVPGLTIKSSGGAGKTTSLFMRGDSTGHILILQNGIDLTDASGLGGSYLETLSLSNIERIEIIKGTQSGVWGANATAGVINIITKSGRKQAEVNLEVGSHGTKKIATTLGANNEQVDFSVHISTFDTNGYSAVREATTSHDKFEKDGYSQTDISFNMGANITKNHRIQTYIKTITGDNEYDGSTGAPLYNPDPDDASSTNSLYQTIKSLGYLYTADKISAKLFIRDTQIDRKFPAFFAEYNGNVRDIMGQLGYDYRKTDNVTISANKKTLDNKTQKYENNGVALTNTNHFNHKKLIITQSIRHDQFDEFENAITGKIGIKNFFTDSLFASANYGTAYNAPLLSQLSRPNPTDLVPEKTESYDISIGADNFEVSYFQSKTEDLIEYVPQPWPTPYYYKNAEKEIVTEGVEANYNHSFDTINTDITVNATWLLAKNEDGDELKYRPENTASVNVDYYGFTNSLLALETRYVGTEYSSDNKQGVQLGEYFVTDIKANYKINDNLSVYGRIVNLLDDNYSTNIRKSTGTTASYVYSNGGRQFFIGIRGKM